MRLLLYLATALTLAAANPTPPPPAPAPLVELAGMTGIIEGLAFRESTGEFFFGDVHHRCVWRRDTAGRITRFTSEADALLGVFQLALDEKHRLLWAATSLLPESAGYTATQKNRCALIALDLTTGRLTRSYPLPPDSCDHVLGDLLLAPDGTIYLPDSRAPVIWQLVPGAAALTIFIESASLKSPQGLALLADGRMLLLSDYSKGLFIIDRTTRALSPVLSPTGNLIRGVDGLLRVGDTIVAVLNYTEPHRILSFKLSPDLARITDAVELSSSLPAPHDFTLLTLVQGRPAIVSHSGWAAYEPGQPQPAPLRTVQIFRLTQ